MRTVRPLLVLTLLIAGRAGAQQPVVPAGPLTLLQAIALGQGQGVDAAIARRSSSKRSRPPWGWWRSCGTSSAPATRSSTCASSATGSSPSVWSSRWSSGFALYASVFALPVFLQNLLGYSAWDTGRVILPGALASALTMAPWAG